MKKKVLGLVALTGVMFVGGSFAYFNQTSSVENPFDTGKYGSTIVEKFNPADGEQWQPGAEVAKEVGVKNIGDQAIVARVKFDEIWTVASGSNVVPIKEIKAADGDKITNVYQESATDGAVANDDTVVHKTLNTTDWVKGSDGWYYYNSIIEPNTTTSNILSKVKLDENADMGLMETSFRYTVDGGKEEVVPTECVKDNKVDLKALSESLKLVKGQELVTYTIVGAAEGATGYSDANYTLTVTTQTVQATDEAVAAVFGDSLPVTWDLEKEKLQ